MFVLLLTDVYGSTPGITMIAEMLRLNYPVRTVSFYQVNLASPLSLIIPPAPLVRASSVEMCLRVSASVSCWCRKCGPNGWLTSLETSKAEGTMV
jgi:hypothetical protein